MTVGDFNGDGKPDLAVANTSGFYVSTVSLLLGTGMGTFAPKVDYPTGGGPYSVATGDFNGDGKPDLAVANENLYSNTVSVLLNTGVVPFADVDGRVITSDGRGLRNAIVSITDSNNNVRTATTSSFGFFSFDNVPTRQMFVFRISSRLFRFQLRNVQIDGNLTLPNFVGLE